MRKLTKNEKLFLKKLAKELPKYSFTHKELVEGLSAMSNSSRVDLRKGLKNEKISE